MTKSHCWSEVSLRRTATPLALPQECQTLHQDLLSNFTNLLCNPTVLGLNCHWKQPDITTTVLKHECTTCPLEPLLLFQHPMPTTNRLNSPTYRSFWQPCWQTPELSAGRATCGHQQDKTSFVGTTSLPQTTLSAIMPHAANGFGTPKQAAKDKGQAPLSKQCTICYSTPHLDSSQLDR